MSLFGDILAVAVVVIAPELAPEIGAFVGAEGAAATAVGMGVIGSGVALAEGKSPQDAIKIGLEAGAASFAGGFISDAVKAQLGNAVSNTVLSAASSGAASGLSSAIMGGKGEDVLRSAIAGAAGGATAAETGSQTAGRGVAGALASRGNVASTLSSAIGGAYKDITPTAQGQGISGSYSAQGNLVAPGQGIGDVVPTGGGQGLVANPNALYQSSMAPAQLQRGGIDETGAYTQQPAYQSAANLITPTGFATDTTTQPSSLQQNQAPTLTETPQSVTQRASSALTQFLGGGYPGVSGVIPGVTMGQTTGVGGGAPPGEVGSQETGGQRRNVWNEASLRLKDALGV